MRKCKECGREENGYGSILNEDGYFHSCAMRHNDEKVKELEQELKIRVEDNAELYAKLCNALNQLNEANEVIKHIKLLKIKAKDCEMTIEATCPEADGYLKKWGVE